VNFGACSGLDRAPRQAQGSSGLGSVRLTFSQQSLPATDPDGDTLAGLATSLPTDEPRPVNRPFPPFVAGGVSPPARVPCPPASHRALLPGTGVRTNPAPAKVLLPRRTGPPENCCHAPAEPSARVEPPCREPACGRRDGRGKCQRPVTPATPRQPMEKSCSPTCCPFCRGWRRPPHARRMKLVQAPASALVASFGSSPRGQLATVTGTVTCGLCRWAQVPAMPPRETDRLSKDEIGKLRARIAGGARWPKCTRA
jgi:hypothetical protein